MKNTTQDKIHSKILVFTIVTFLVLSVGGGLLFAKSLNNKLIVYKGPPIEANAQLSNQTVLVTSDLSNKDSIHTVSLSISVKNNTVDPLTNVIFILPPDIGTIESPIATRVTNLPQQGGDNVFTMGTVASGSSKKTWISLYASEKKNYTLNARIETQEKFSATANPVTLTAQ